MEGESGLDTGGESGLDTGGSGHHETPRGESSRALTHTGGGV